MRNEQLYQFLTARFKERGMAIERMPEIFGFSRSSLYRYMTGIIRISPEVQEQFNRVLDLNEAEQRQLAQLIGLSEFDSTMIASRYALDSFVFGKPQEPERCESIKFAYYDKDTFLRTSEEIYDTIRSLVSQEGAVCKVRVTNCVSSGVFPFLRHFLRGLFAASRSVGVEHLLAFSEKDHLYNTETLINIIPLLQHKSYSVYYSTSAEVASAQFSDSVIVEVNRLDDSRFFFLSFLKNGLSLCLATSDGSVSAFGLSSYEALKESYRVALLEASSLDLFGSRIAQLQENTSCYLLKPNCCYDRIPMKAYRHMLARATPEELANVQQGLAGGEAFGGVEEVLSILERRIASSHKNRHIDVCSENGLREFAKTGRITDHLDFLPSFTPEERRWVLEYIRDRYCDPKDSFTLYLTREDIFENGYIIMAYEDIGVLIEYSREDYRQGLCSNLFVKHKLIADVITDYVKNHIPDNHACGEGETVAFLNSLIRSLE